MNDCVVTQCVTPVSPSQNTPRFVKESTPDQAKETSPESDVRLTLLSIVY